MRSHGKRARHTQGSKKMAPAEEEKFRRFIFGESAIVKMN